MSALPLTGNANLSVKFGGLPRGSHIGVDTDAFFQNVKIDRGSATPWSSQEDCSR
jgi:hypothetical protein